MLNIEYQMLEGDLKYQMLEGDDFKCQAQNVERQICQMSSVICWKENGQLLDVGRIACQMSRARF